MDVLVFVALNSLALVAAWGLSRVLMPRAGGLQGVLCVLVSLPVLVIPTLTLLGALGKMTATAAGLAMTLQAVVLHGAANRRHESGLPSGAPAEPALGLLPWLATGALAGLLCLQGVAFVHGQLLSAWHPHWDDLSYHATMAAHWLQAGRLRLAPYHYHAYYPGNGELFAAWFMLATKLDAYASLAGALWMTVSVLTVGLICRRLGCSRPTTLLGVTLLMVCMPFWKQAGTFAAVDLAATAAAGAALAFAIPEPNDSAADTRSRALLCGALLGIAIGCKITFAPLALLIAAYIAFERRAALRETLLLGVLFAVAAFACGSWYYFRNWSLTGNPLFPAAVLGFEGPLDPAARAPTSLVYQLGHVSSGRLSKAWRELFNWPTPVAVALVVGYLATLVGLVRKSALKSREGRLLLLLLVAGLSMLWVTAAGPFSGTANSEFARLQVRLRFFLPTVLLAVPLLVYWIERLSKGHGIVLLVSAIGVAVCTRYELWHDLAFMTAGALAAWGIRRWPPRLALGDKAIRAIGVASLVLVPVAAAGAMTYKQPLNDEYIKKVMPGWNLLRFAEPGTKVAWFATFEGYKYYRAFGRGLSYTPIAVEPDGREAEFLHEYWRRDNPTWWDRKDRPYEPNALVHNLHKLGIRYVMVLKRHGGEWPPQRQILLEAKGVKAIQKRGSVTLFEIGVAPEKKR